MFKKILAVLSLFIILPVFAEERFSAGVSFVSDKEDEALIKSFKQEMPKIERGFIDLNYTINYKPLSMLSDSDFFTKKQDDTKLTFSNYQMHNESYDISLSTGEAKGNPDSSENLQTLLKMNPNNKDLLFAYAIQLKNEKKLDMALETANKAVQADPDYALAHFLKGDILRNLQKYKDACYEYIYAAQINPYCSDAYYNIARILEIMGDKNLALDYYKIAYQINPKDEEVRSIILDNYKDL